MQGKFVITFKVSNYEYDYSLEQVIPQGSVLVPLLFHLYVNNLKHVSDILEYVYCNSLLSSSVYCPLC